MMKNSIVFISIFFVGHFAFLYGYDSCSRISVEFDNASEVDELIHAGEYMLELNCSIEAQDFFYRAYEIDNQNISIMHKLSMSSVRSGDIKLGIAMAKKIIESSNDPEILALGYFDWGIALRDVKPALAIEKWQISLKYKKAKTVENNINHLSQLIEASQKKPDYQWLVRYTGKDTTYLDLDSQDDYKNYAAMLLQLIPDYEIQPGVYMRSEYRTISNSGIPITISIRDGRYILLESSKAFEAFLKALIVVDIKEMKGAVLVSVVDFGTAGRSFYQESLVCNSSENPEIQEIINQWSSQELPGIPLRQCPENLK